MLTEKRKETGAFPRTGLIKIIAASAADSKSQVIALVSTQIFIITVRIDSVLYIILLSRQKRMIGADLFLDMKISHKLFVML